MRRADPSPAAPDGDGPPLPAYADSDVGSSPRSVGGVAGGRTGYLTEEPPPVKWDDAAFTRVKLMCSYGGRILPRPHDNLLRYIGGESRIAVVSRSITFSELTTKLSRMFGSSVMIKYQLPNEDLDALISVTSDEDLENMMEEYDRLQSAGKSVASAARLRLFLFPSKLERSQTASLSEMMENNHSRERWFVDILNGLPVLSRVRSETSSIVSETPEYPSQGNNLDALEEWAAVASYGNSMPSAEQLMENKQGNSVSPTALFGSLLQQASPNEAASAPGSPSPLKPKPTTMGSSSSAPPAVISLLSAMADAASKGLPTPPTEVDGTIGSFSSKTRLGSGDSSGSIPEQRKHVDSEMLLTSDKSILSSSVGGVEQLLPAGLMDDDDLSQKYSAKGSFDEVSGSSETAFFDAGLHRVVSESSSKAFKGDLVSESTALMGQPIFDDELSPTHVLARNLNVLQLDEGASSPHVLSPSSTSSAQLVPPALAPQQPMPKFGVDEKSKHMAFPVSPHAGAGGHLGNEDKVMQQAVPVSALNGSPASKGDIDDGLSKQVSPSLAHYLPSLVVSQQLSSAASDEDILMPQIFGATTKDAETTRKVQVTTSATPPVTVQQQKLPTAAPVSSYLYQQSPTLGLEVPISTGTYTTQAPGIQFPFTSQIASPVVGMVTSPLPPIAVPGRPANTAGANRPAAGISRPQSPPGVASLHTQALAPQVRTTSPPPAPTMLMSNVSQLEAFKGHAPVSSNVAPAAVLAEGVRSNPYQQGEVVNIQRQASDPMHGQRLAAMTSQLGSQFNPANLNPPPAPGMPTRFRAVGLPLQQVVEGVPLQQAPLVGLSEKKGPTPMQRVGPSARPPSAPGGQYNYTSAIPLSPALGGAPRYTATPSNIMMGVPVSSPDTPSFAGANPFADNFQGISTYQDRLEVAPPTDQQQRRPIR
ncbi:hypothetical protein GOP47_0025154 [Adiantum capillus-veneris]|uniref:PB1 domain-containing protein n=1 Tax=Adiantum capillus-veneris TaxID=13818 RepID=A0A9D4U5B2_ADICA|nr:hypothetical protein GOP47_0025154 [Adiantum capillus-veneris]